eukprot:726843-Amphidinium_carterae.1
MQRLGSSMRPVEPIAGPAGCVLGAGPARGSFSCPVKLVARFSGGMLGAGPAPVRGTAVCAGVVGPALTGGADELRTT